MIWLTNNFLAHFQMVSTGQKNEFKFKIDEIYLQIIRTYSSLFERVDQSLIQEQIRDFWCVMTWGLSILSCDLLSSK